MTVWARGLREVMTSEYIEQTRREVEDRIARRNRIAPSVITERSGDDARLYDAWGVLAFQALLLHERREHNKRVHRDHELEKRRARPGYAPRRCSYCGELGHFYPKCDQLAANRAALPVQLRRR